MYHKDLKTGRPSEVVGSTWIFQQTIPSANTGPVTSSFVAFSKLFKLLSFNFLLIMKNESKTSISQNCHW